MGRVIVFNSLDVDGTKTIVGDGNAFLPKTLCNTLFSE